MGRITRNNITLWAFAVFLLYSIVHVPLARGAQYTYDWPTPLLGYGPFIEGSFTMSGANPAFTGVTGPVQRCSRYSGGVIDCYGAEMMMPGTLLTASVSSVPRAQVQRDTCYLYGLVSVYYRAESFLGKGIYRSMSDVLKYGNFVALSTEPHVENRQCSLVKGTFNLVFDSSTFYVNAGENTQNNVIKLANSPASAAWVSALNSNGGNMISQYTVVACSTPEITSSCVAMYPQNMYGAFDIDKPVVPVTCDVNANLTVNFGTVSRDQVGLVTGESIDIVCNKEASLRLEIINTNIEMQGVNVNIGFGELMSKTVELVNSNSYNQNIKAEITNISPSSLGDFEGSTILLLTLL